MARSVIQIYNRALQKLGAARISSLTEDSRNARACNACYDIVRQSELEDHPWNFSIQRTSLAASSVAPQFGKQNSFQVPANFVRLAPPDPLYNDNFLDWQIEGNLIFTDYAAPLQIRYVSDVTDPNIMSPLFCEALACRMAREMCEEITQSNTKKQGVDQDYELIIRRAKRSNGIQNVAADPPTDNWITARL